MNRRCSKRVPFAIVFVGLVTVMMVLGAARLVDAAPACPQVLRIDVDGPNSDIDPGWTGIEHDGQYVGLTLTMAISGCAGATQPTCGACTLSGPLANAGGATFNNRRCADKTWLTCITDGDCISQGAAGPCHVFFGPPLPYAGGGVAVCVTNEITGAATGNVDVEGGDIAMSLPYLAKIYSSPSLDNPCPRCLAGSCDAGPRVGMPCTVNGTSLTFSDDVSFDCPPNLGTFIGPLTPSGLNLSTGTSTMTLSAASPNCNAGGWGGFKCLCQTCNNAAWTGCNTNADCVAVGATVCGGKRCLTGANNGAPCTGNPDCPGGVCGVPGQGTAPNQCDDATCSANPVDTDSSNEGICAAGPFEQFCSIQTYRACLSDSDCTPTGGGTCTVGQFRECFTDNGMIGGSISATGVVDPPVDATGSPTLAGLACIPPTSAGSVNAVAGFPGPGRVTLPSTSTLADELADGNVPSGGGTVTTDTEADGATPADPLETTITSPNGGEIILGEQAATGTPPGGFTFLDKQVNITAPPASAASPLVLVFRIDASAIPLGENQNTITVLKNNLPVGNCPGSSTAAPDPCVTGRALLGDGDVQLTILTSTASRWNFATGAALGPCDPTPDPSCLQPTLPQKATILLKDKGDDTKDVLVWKWLKGTTTFSQLGNTGTVYNLCIYDGTGVVSFASTPPFGSSNWSSNFKGYKYKDKLGTSDGVTQVILKSHADPGKAKIIFKGKGLNLDMPSVGGLTSPVTVQLHRSDDPLCWSATYSAPFIKQNSEQFKDKAD